MDVSIMKSFFLFSLLMIKTSALTSLNDDLFDLLIGKYSKNGKNLSLDEFESFVSTCNLGRVRNLPDQAQNNSLLLSPKENLTSSNCNLSKTQSGLKFCNFTRQCLSSRDLMNVAASITNSSSLATINRDNLIQLCPTLLIQIASQVCTQPQETIKEGHNARPTHVEVWVYGMLFVTLISLSSLVGVSVMPAIGKEVYNKLLTFLIGLAVGSLSGSAVFHLLPQAFNLINEETDNHDYLWISLVVLSGIYLFFMTERFMKIYIDSQKRKLQNLIGSCSDNETLQCTTSTISEEYRNSMGDMGSKLALNKQIFPVPSHTDNIQTRNSDLVVKKGPHSHEHHIEFPNGQSNKIATVAWMIIFGDGLHNFIDGLSIGAAFNKSILTGVSISVAVVCEEFPHELGDFAVLLKSGMSMKQALMYNFLSACTCYLGLIVGILLGELETAGIYIFALAGGVFLYISLVDMIPELNEAVESASKESVSKALYILLLQNLGWLLGVAILFVLAYYNSAISFE